MHRPKVIFLLVLAGLILGGGPGPASGQDRGSLVQMINSGYDLLEKGQTDQAQKIYEELLRKYPDNPLALNNLGAIQAKKGRYDEALAFLNRAKTRALGYRVTLDRVCDPQGVCAAFRIADDPLQGEELEWLIKRNILSVEMARVDRQPRR
jgi:tetratricopeptide (TPR) repeat protein